MCIRLSNNDANSQDLVQQFITDKNAIEATSYDVQRNNLLNKVFYLRKEKYGQQASNSSLYNSQLFIL